MLTHFGSKDDNLTYASRFVEKQRKGLRTRRKSRVMKDIYHGCTVIYFSSQRETEQEVEAGGVIKDTYIIISLRKGPGNTFSHLKLFSKL